MAIPTNLVLISLIISLFFSTKPVAAQFEFNSEYCIDDVGNFTAKGNYASNLKVLLRTLVNQAYLSTFNNATIGEGIDQIYGLFMCRGDLDLVQCHDCVNTASLKIIEMCRVQKEAIVWYSECLIRYANRSIFSRTDESYYSYSYSVGNVSDTEKFDGIIPKTMNEVIMQATYNKSSKGYAISEANFTSLNKLYVLAQCTVDIVGSQCERCLRAALRDMGGCCGTQRISLFMFLPSCWLLYDQRPLVGDDENNTPATPRTPFFTSPFSAPSEMDNNSSLLPPGDSSAATKSSDPTISFIIGIVVVASLSYVISL